MRPMAEYCKQQLGPGQLIGVEIGVAKGDHAAELLQGLDFKLLHLIDTWQPYPGANGGLITEYVPYYETTAKRFRYFNNVLIHRQDSESASLIFPDNHFDFIYIDGDHDYNPVKTDILSWYPKLRQRGVMGGHDYHCDTVKRAVNDCAAILRGQRLAKITVMVEYTDWWYR